MLSKYDHNNNVVLTVDYDDGFIAYLNGVEILRRNIGTKGDFQPYTATAKGEHGASMDAGHNRRAAIETIILDCCDFMTRGISTYN